jgi:hypothetical protein
MNELIPENGQNPLSDWLDRRSAIYTLYVRKDTCVGTVNIHIKLNLFPRIPAIPDPLSAPGDRPIGYA